MVALDSVLYRVEVSGDDTAFRLFSNLYDAIAYAKMIWSELDACTNIWKVMLKDVFSSKGATAQIILTDEDYGEYNSYFGENDDDNVTT